jgi:hypothetical protein
VHVLRIEGNHTLGVMLFLKHPTPAVVFNTAGVTTYGLRYSTYDACSNNMLPERKNEASNCTSWVALQLSCFVCTSCVPHS